MKTTAKKFSIIIPLVVLAVAVTLSIRGELRHRAATATAAADIATEQPNGSGATLFTTLNGIAGR